MYDEDDIDAAVTAGVLNAQAAAAFREFIGQRRAGSEVDEERVRLVTGFNDVFVSIAIGLILVAVIQLGQMVAPILGAALAAGVSWGLAEYFTARRRMALPSILLLLGFVAGIFMAAYFILDLKSTAASNENIQFWGMLVCAGLAVVAAYAHWRRFRVPITVAVGAAAAFTAMIIFLLWIIPPLREFWLLLMFPCGLAMFTLAMFWDTSDRTRTTRRSDVAFWLHLVAAPLIVHPVFSTLVTPNASIGAEIGRAIAAISLYVVLALIALAVDRRALLVSALAYVLYAITTLVSSAGGVTEAFALTALVIGSALLLLSAFWHSTRRVVVRILPAKTQARLPSV